MQAHDLDQSYTALAQAIDQAGAHSELFLAMLSLKLITQQQNNLQNLDAISVTLRDLQRHQISSHDKTTA